jgi:hypothetical protein
VSEEASSKIPNTTPATVARIFDAFSCFRGNARYLNISNADIANRDLGLT